MKIEPFIVLLSDHYTSSFLDFFDIKILFSKKRSELFGGKMLNDCMFMSARTRLGSASELFGNREINIS